MQIVILRQKPTDDCTLGRLTCSQTACYTLEPGLDFPKGRIPAGSYQIAVTWSPRFGRPMPEVLEVPGWQGIRIHPGNTEADTEGCILVGTYTEINRVDDSTLAFDRLFAAIDQAITVGDEVQLQINEAGE